MIGKGEQEMELYPEDEAFAEVVEGIESRFAPDEAIDSGGNLQEDYLAYILADELFVEYIYDSDATQFLRTTDGKREEIDPDKLLFPLTGPHNSELVIIYEGDQAWNNLRGLIGTSTELIKYVNSLLGITESAADGTDK